MKTDAKDLVRMLFGDERLRRFTQDSPILPEVWLKYAEVNPGDRVDLLLSPFRQSTSGRLHHELKTRLESERIPRHLHYPEISTTSTIRQVDQLPLVYNESHVVAHLTLGELVRCALPLSKWWMHYCWRGIDQGMISDNLLGSILESVRKEEPREPKYSADLIWFLRIVGRLSLQEVGPPILGEGASPGDEILFRSALGLLNGVTIRPYKNGIHLWSVSLNRVVTPAVDTSTSTVKADAVRNLFGISAEKICWAIVDSGIDADHPAFIDQSIKALQGPYRYASRVRETYDFTRLRDLLDPDSMADDSETIQLDPEKRRQMKELKSGLRSGRVLNWDALMPLLRVPHDRSYVSPKNEHGTHVAGIVGADWHKDIEDALPNKKELVGMCPDIRFFDLRVLGDDGAGSEFTVLAALQFIRHLNSHKDVPVIHGANLSLSLTHDVTSSACGRSPVCEECERLLGNGVVVVVAAGNRGYATSMASSMGVADYQAITITDPGNAEGVITVGSTHRERPHTYGVSYFSSRGPTGDGRSKPDLVAPGEKIVSTVPGGKAKAMDGTSMAAPHVSGAAALLMARHKELIGQPVRVKQILCETATDLGRERHFQGAGLVDILRAIQSL